MLEKTLWFCQFVMASISATGGCLYNNQKKKTNKYVFDWRLFQLPFFNYTQPIYMLIIKFFKFNISIIWRKSIRDHQILIARWIRFFYYNKLVLLQMINWICRIRFYKILSNLFKYMIYAFIFIHKSMLIIKYRQSVSVYFIYIIYMVLNRSHENTIEIE